jgi:hypothetical protein
MGVPLWHFISLSGLVWIEKKKERNTRIKM